MRLPISLLFTIKESPPALKTPIFKGLVLVALMFPLASFAEEGESKAKGEQAAPVTQESSAEIHALLTSVDDLFRSQGSHATITMHVKTSHFERSMTIEAWSKGSDRSLMRIVAPAKEKGVTTLKVEDNLWNYLPKVDRTIKVPASMMSGSWMGSHFTNDDLVRESRFDQDFETKITQRPEPDGSGEWIVVLTPKADTAVVWGRIESHINGKDRLPTKVVYFDEDGEKVRTMTYHDLKSFSGRTIPSRMKLVPEDHPEESTEIIYDELELDLNVPDSKFSKSALRR